MEKYLTKLQQLDTVVIFKLRTRMTKLKKYFHEKYQVDNIPDPFMNQTMKNNYSALVLNLVHYI